MHSIKKMIKLDNFSKVEFYKFAFQVKIHKKSNKNYKKIPLPLGLPLPLTPQAAKKSFDAKNSLSE